MKRNIYSRKKIRLPNLKGYYGIKIVLIIFLFTMLTILILFLRFAYPVFKTTCENAAASKGTKIINDEVHEVMKNYTYNNLIDVEKDVNGDVTLVKANVIAINEIITKIISNIQTEFDKIPRINVFINMGSVSGVSILKNLEPKFEIELESAGKIDSTIKTEFKSVGINQTYHKIFLDINSSVGILTPFSTFSKEINTEVLLTESVIVGEVPESYYNLDGLEELQDTYNFIE